MFLREHLAHMVLCLHLAQSASRTSTARLKIPARIRRLIWSLLAVALVGFSAMLAAAVPVAIKRAHQH
jgi:hypothetical protein